VMNREVEDRGQQRQRIGGADSRPVSLEGS
jgi:hypothetical protein